MKTVAGVLSIETLNNMGENLLQESTSFLLKKAGISEIIFLPLAPSCNKLKYGLWWKNIISSVISFFAWFVFPKKRDPLLSFAYKFKYKKFYEEELKKVDAIVYAIGALKYSTQDFSFNFYLINKIASDYGIPVMMSAMSIEKPDANDWRYRQLVEAVNMPCVKVITTRDGKNGLERLNSYYVKNKNIFTDFVGDSALFIPEIYRTKIQERDCIGIGVIRKNICRDYGNDFSSVQLLDFYVSLLRNLEKRRVNWVLFCNGMIEDFRFGKLILKKAGFDKSKLLPIPRSPQEFLDMITRFKVVFGARLHACISSFALDVPVVGFFWDDKLRFFAETMKIQSLFCEATELDSDAVSEKLINAVDYKYDVMNRNSYKEKTENSFQYFADSIIKRG